MQSSDTSRSDSFIEVSEWQSAVGIEHSPGSQTNHVVLILVGILLVNLGYWIAFHDVSTVTKMFQ